ncbi:MAG: hypothetical protein U0T78_07120 [Cloacibacterium normanense]
MTILIWLKPFLDASTNALSEVAKELGVVIIASLFEKERKVCTTTLPQF